ncbi:MAG TPA: hypothetical protein GX716_00615 [Firmicutes bacterium]|nr:hypothetical protein [Candidatus Fermentithermobacillaceae bacterium]
MRKMVRMLTVPILILAFFVIAGVGTMTSDLYGFPMWPWIVVYVCLFRWLIKNLQKE